jgi:type II secretory pathway pseudopilin PulG
MMMMITDRPTVGFSLAGPPSWEIIELTPSPVEVHPMSRPRPAFTLFQLLVVLAVLLILLALLLPAVQKVREAAARIQSQNNLKMIGIAAHNYHDANGVFPAGCDGKHYSAAAKLLPYIEQDNLYKTIDFTKDADDNANATAAKVLIKEFVSPLDPLEPAQLGAGKTGPTNYLFNAGSKASLDGNDGIFYLDSGIRLTDVTDGTSNTLMGAETTRGDGGNKAINVRRQHVRLKQADLKGLKEDAGVKDWQAGQNIAADRGSAWIDGRFLKGTFNSGRKVNDSRPDIDCAGAGGWSGMRNLEDGTNVLLCDGSVRWLRPSIKLDTLKALATRAGGEVFNLNDD